MSLHNLRRGIRRYGVGDFGSSTYATNSTASNWATRVVTNGGASPSSATVAAFSNFCYGLASDGLTSLMLGLNAFAPDSLIACMTPLIVGLGGDPWSNFNFVAGDLSVNGLLGHSATPKYLDTGVSPSADLPDDTSLGYTLYNYAGGNENALDIGVWSSGGSNDALYISYGGTCYFDCHNSSGGRKSAANSNFTGYISANRTSSTASAVYKANSSIGHTTLLSATGESSVGTRTTTNVYVFGANNNSSPGTVVNSNPTCSNKRFSFAAVHYGLSVTQSAALYARVQALRISLGGGYV